MRILLTLAVAVFVCAVVPSASFAFYSVTDGLNPTQLKKDNVKIAVVKVKATRVVRPETRRRFADGASTYTHAIYSMDLELIEQLHGAKLTDADLSNVGYSNVPVDNAWALGPSDPKGCYYIMGWRIGHPCGQASGVRFSPGPDLPVLIDTPKHPSVKLLKELLTIVHSSLEECERKAALDAKLKQLRKALGIQVPGLDQGLPIKLGATVAANGKDTADVPLAADFPEAIPKLLELLDSKDDTTVLLAYLSLREYYCYPPNWHSGGLVVDQYFQREPLQRRVKSWQAKFHGKSRKQILFIRLEEESTCAVLEYVPKVLPRDEVFVVA